ncbi:hypothetical protein GGF31_005973 [Allomyces arbusculus]|nr:hypothetical protein GGF31_005973 [Allomyces arbusculus]
MSTIPGGSLLSKLTHPSIHTTRVFILLGIHFLSFLVLWNIPYLGRILDPHKLLVVAFHEFSHALVGKCTGAVIESIEVTPDQGDATRLRGGNACLVLPAGYIGSSVIGSALIFCTFNLMACKIAAGFVALSMVLTMWWARDHSFTRWLTHFWLAVLVYEWAVFEYGPQFYVIAMGVMSVTYSFWDMVEDLIRRVWNIPYLGRLLDPYKLLVVAFHEFSHAFVGKCTGAKIESVEVNPDQGGATRLRGGNACLVLPAGYIGSSVIGSALIFCSFNVLACKIASCIVALSMILTMWWARDHAFTRWLTLFWLATLGYEWIVFADYGPQFYVIAAGVMSVTYSLWDMVEDLIRRRVNHSDAAIFAKRYGCTPQFWGVFWFLFSLLILAGTITSAIFVWY